MVSRRALSSSVFSCSYSPVSLGFHREEKKNLHKSFGLINKNELDFMMNNL